MPLSPSKVEKRSLLLGSLNYRISILGQKEHKKENEGPHSPLPYVAVSDKFLENFILFFFVDLHPHTVSPFINGDLYLWIF